MGYPGDRNIDPSPGSAQERRGKEKGEEMQGQNKTLSAL